MEKHLPTGWKLLKLRDIADFGSGATPLRIKGDRYFADSGIPWVKTTDLNKEIADPSYVLQWLNARVKDWFSFAASSRKDPNITKDHVASFPITIPEIHEQRIISSEIKKWDQAIDLTERLIVAKQDRRKWSMQNLLTGKYRLPGFTGTWQKRAIGEIARKLLSEIKDD